MAKTSEATCSMVFVSQKNGVTLKIWAFKTPVLTHATVVKWGLILLVPIRSLKADYNSHRPRGVNAYGCLKKKTCIKNKFLWSKQNLLPVGVWAGLALKLSYREFGHQMSPLLSSSSAMQFPGKFQV